MIAKTEFALGADDSIELLTTDDTTATTFISLTGNRFTQTIIGNAGGNLLADGGGSGADVLRGLDGRDIYIVRSKNTIIVEEAGQGTSDRVSASIDFALEADDHIERLTTTSRNGTASIDLTGNAYAQIITGNAGNNVLRSTTGAPDTMEGLAGDDVYRVFNKNDKIVEVENKGTDRVITTIDFVLGEEDSIELFTTSNSTGTSNIDLTGNEFAQTIIGNAGDNRIEGKDGSDTLRGLGGNDTFIFKDRITPTNIDMIADFDVTSDTIAIDNDPFFFSALRWEPDGTLRGRFFKANKEGVATDGNDTIIYDTDSGELYYDPDGSGSGRREHFATLSSGLDLKADNFEVI